MIYHEFAEYYDQLMDLDYADFLATWHQLSDFEGRDVLEYGCGTGNMTQLLLPLVNSIDALDRSAAMLMRAQQKISSPKCRFYLADGEDFDIQRQYDRIGLFVDVVNYIPPEEFKELLEWFGRHLAPGGEILFDVSSADKLEHQLGQQIFRFDTADGELYWVNEYDPSARQLDFSLIIYRESAAGCYQRLEEFHTQYVYTEADIKRLAEGYQIDRIKQPDREFYRLRKETECER